MSVLISCGGKDDPPSPSTAKAITVFSFTNPLASATIDENAKTISITVPYNTNVTSLIATFTTTGKSVRVGSTVQVSGITPNDFTNPVLYVVTAANGSTATYTVTVTVAPSSEKAITAFSFNNPAASGTIDENAKTISLTVPYGTNVTALVAVFTTTGASVHVGLTVQVSGITPNDFTNPVSYAVTAADGSSVTYTVTVTVTKNSAKAITAFSLTSQAATGIINESSKAIFVFVPFGTGLTALVPTFTTTGASVKVGSTIQKSGVTPNNFTNPVIYTVTAEDNSTATYTVRITFLNYIYLQSDSGDFIGQGKTYSYNQANSKITLSASGIHLSLSIAGDQDWSSDFQVPNSLSQFHVGYYGNLTRYPFNDPTVGGLDWGGDGRGCNTLTGWFAVDNVTYNNGNLSLIDLRFEQHCEGGTPALHGLIHWTPYDNTIPPGPVYPPPNGLWKPAPGSTPTSGNYIYLQSDSGDYIGQGKTYTYTPTNAQLTVSATGGHFSTKISANGGADWWYGDFQTMNSINQLQLGYYGNLQRYPFHNPALGGLNWDGEGRGCNTLTGWFTVDNVTYNNGTLTAVDLRFEQHCEGFSPSLHGQIHWTQ